MQGEATYRGVGFLVEHEDGEVLCPIQAAADSKILDGVYRLWQDRNWHLEVRNMTNPLRGEEPASV